jgi:hypothetical protein
MTILDITTGRVGHIPTVGHTHTPRESASTMTMSFTREICWAIVGHRHHMDTLHCVFDSTTTHQSIRESIEHVGKLTIKARAATQTLLDTSSSANCPATHPKPSQQPHRHPQGPSCSQLRNNASKEEKDTISRKKNNMKKKMSTKTLIKNG